MITETVIFCIRGVCVCILIFLDIFSCEFEDLASVVVTVYHFLRFQVNILDIIIRM